MRSLSRLVPACAGSLLLATGCPQPQAGPAGGDAGGTAAVAASVNGEPIRVDEVDAHIKEALFAEASGEGDPAQLYELRSDALDEMVDERLLADAAAQAGKDPEALLAEAEDQAAEVTYAEVTAFYEQIQSRLGDEMTLEDVADRIRSTLEDRRRVEAREAYVASLREEADVEIAIEPPRIAVEAVGPSLGPEDAAVTIVEFSDYQCPFCKRAHPTVNALVERYPEQVRVVYRHFPLDSIHPQARAAAEAAACAEDQGRFWEYHDLLFAGTSDFGSERLRELAGEAELDVAAFDACVAEGRHKDRVQEDLVAGQEAGVNGTPAFFVNGIPLSGAQPLEKFVELIEAELARGEGAS